MKRWMSNDSKGSDASSFDVSIIQGEKGTGFEKAGDLGEFECGNCKYMKQKPYVGCYERNMIEKSKEPRNPDNSVKVDAEDCCEAVKRVGRKDRDKGGSDKFMKE